MKSNEISGRKTDTLSQRESLSNGGPASKYVASLSSEALRRASEDMPVAHPLISLVLAVVLTFCLPPMSSPPTLVSVAFVVRGRVQGVFFRRHTHQQAVALGLVGHVRNVGDGTVAGLVQGARESVDRMKSWLETTGKSIECCFEG